MVHLNALASEIILRGRAGGADLIVTVNDAPVSVSTLPFPLLLGLGALILSAVIAVAMEIRSERRHIAVYSAARF